MARRRKRERSNGSGALVVLCALAAVLGAGAAVERALARWWPLLALAALVALAGAGLRAQARRARARAAVARQVELDRRVATTDAMTGRDFEHLVARLLARDGWSHVQVSGGAGDLGADVVARSPRDGTLLVVQCKRYGSRAVGSPDLQRFLGTVYTHHGAAHALYVTTSTFTRPATALAASTDVVLVDRRALAAWMAGAPLAMAPDPQEPGAYPAAG